MNLGSKPPEYYLVEFQDDRHLGHDRHDPFSTSCLSYALSRSKNRKILVLLRSEGCYGSNLRAWPSAPLWFCSWRRRSGQGWRCGAWLSTPSDVHLLVSPSACITACKGYGAIRFWVFTWFKDGNYCGCTPQLGEVRFKKELIENLD